MGETGGPWRGAGEEGWHCIVERRRRRMMRGPIVAIALVTATCLAAGEPASSARDPVRWRHVAIEHALGNAATIADPYRRAGNETGVARAQARIGEQSATERTLEMALASAGKIGEPTFQGWVLQEIVLAQIAANDLTGAKQTAQRIRSERPRGAALLEISRMQLRGGNLEAALGTALSIDDHDSAGQALREVVAVQAATGQLTAARQTFKQIEDPFYRGQAAGDIAVADARAGRIPQALSLATSIRKAYRAQVFERVAVEQADAGDIAGALKTIDQIDADIDRALVLGRVSTRTRVRSDREQAQQIFSRASVVLEGAKDPRQRKALSWSHMARMRIAVDDVAGAKQCLVSALASAAGMPEGTRRDEAYDAIARTQIRAKDNAAALETAAHVDERVAQALLIRDIVASQADAGADALLQTAAVRKDPLTQTAALFGVIGAQLLRRDEVRARPEAVNANIAAARALVSQIPDVQLRPAAFAALAAAQAATGNASGGKEIFDDATQAAQSFDSPEQRAAAWLRIVDALDERLPFLGQPLRLDLPSPDPEPS